jgi:GT2 family glycosyltransferase
MAELGFTCLRTYTMPPRWLLNLAEAHGLYVLVGLAWEEHVAFLEDRRQARAIEERIRRQVASCVGHLAVLAYAIGNEIPTGVVRWHGPRRIERYLQRLYEATRAEDPGGLVTKISYPSTEYLALPFLDFVAFNVYLEREPDLVAYLARLQNIAGERPLVLAEVGLDSRRNGEIGQATALDWQVRAASAAGCAGVFLFAWTDEWHRGGHPIEDWDFGLTQRDRRPKPALDTVRRAFDEGPFPPGQTWPRASVVVCSYNGARVIRDCLEGLREQTYSDYEMLVVDDGSTDATAAIASSYGAHVISTPNQGLSSARNVGLAAATGEIVAYTDDDARPDPDWLLHLVAAFQRSDYAGIGGPNIAPPGDGPVAECVANAPGGPIHVLLTDTEAEHIPGCNMAFRKHRLEAIGGFDTQFRSAGDDVDVCWRLQECGWKLGFSPAAMVWHHRRNSVRAYWKQQVGYGKAEALLERKWPEKFNAVGHLAWMGRLYTRGLTQTLGLRTGRIYHGIWGCAPFQSLYQPAPGLIASLPLIPEWYLVTAALTVVCVLGIVWPPLLASGVLLALAIGAPVAQAATSAARASFPSPARSVRERAQRRGLTAFLHLMQPLARLTGRLKNGLSPWRTRGAVIRAMPRTRGAVLWSEHWQAPVAWLQALETSLGDMGARVRRGPPGQTGTWRFAWASWALSGC